ncbi:hypothetical protein Xbed_03068 [Xenorhabdus beddingii]|uniref:Uncharacterized protein n=1 Tax=Xenorhabdus beddingii TaxID=40578 RepID=A0A1Y2SJ22_9GAMM|nr:hypothetical protein Xbed_03068 [Xenorhabdus beddingii]
MTEKLDFTRNHRVNGGKTIFQALDAQAATVQIHIGQFQAEEFGYSETMNKSHKQHANITLCMGMFAQLLKQCFYLRLGQVFAF